MNFLQDNRPIDKYFYQIVIFTGIRTNAGTKSKVNYKTLLFFQLSKGCFRSLSFYRVMMMKHKFTLWQILIARSCSVVRLTHLSPLCPSIDFSSYSFVPFCNIILENRSLGPLNSMCVSHDDSGEDSSASWFLKYVIVRDLQTMKKSYFICQQWLAANKGDGLVR